MPLLIVLGVSVALLLIAVVAQRWHPAPPYPIIKPNKKGSS